MKPLVRFTIGPVKRAGFSCLNKGIEKFRSLYESEIVVLHNGLTPSQVSFLEKMDVQVLRQEEFLYKIPPKGVAWKLYPPRLTMDRHEIFIDNDIIIREKIDEIEFFLEKNDHVLLLEDEQRAYGNFDRFIKKDILINSGIFGLCPFFDLKSYMDFYIKEWNENSGHENESSVTFDEQGLIALSLLSHKKYFLIKNKTITKCDINYKKSKGMHFIKLNRKRLHSPFAEYINETTKLFL